MVPVPTQRPAPGARPKPSPGTNAVVMAIGGSGMTIAMSFVVWGYYNLIYGPGRASWNRGFFAGGGSPKADLEWVLLWVGAAAVPALVAAVSTRAVAPRLHRDHPGTVAWMGALLCALFAPLLALLAIVTGDCIAP